MAGAGAFISLSAIVSQPQTEGPFEWIGGVTASATCLVGWVGVGCTALRVEGGAGIEQETGRALGEGEGRRGEGGRLSISASLRSRASPQETRRRVQAVIFAKVKKQVHQSRVSPASGPGLHSQEAGCALPLRPRRVWSKEPGM